MTDVPMLHVEEVQERLTRRFGPGVVAWCAQLPALADTVARQWRLQLEPALPTGGSSVVLPCQASDDEPMVLKLSPDLKIAADEATALDLWSASPHMVLLHDADLERGAPWLRRVFQGCRVPLRRLPRVC